VAWNGSSIVGRSKTLAQHNLNMERTEREPDSGERVRRKKT